MTCTSGAAIYFVPRTPGRAFALQRSHTRTLSAHPPCLPISREYLEKNYVETSGLETVKLAIKALTEVVEGSSKNIEIAIVERVGGLRFLSDQDVDDAVAAIAADKAAAAPGARAAGRSGGSGEGQ